MLAKLKNKAIKALGGFTEAELNTRVYEAQRDLLNKVVTDEFLRICKWHLNKKSKAWLERVADQVSNAMREAKVSVFRREARGVGSRELIVNTINLRVEEQRFGFSYVTFGEDDNP